jgi:hypothetical protein
MPRQGSVGLTSTFDPPYNTRLNDGPLLFNVARPVNLYVAVHLRGQFLRVQRE